MRYLLGLVTGAVAAVLVFFSAAFSLALFFGMDAELKLGVALLLGGVLGLLAAAVPPEKERLWPYAVLAALGAVLALPFDPVGLGPLWSALLGALAGLVAGYGLRDLDFASGEVLELLGLRLLRAAGFLVFVFAVVFPFWAMLAASLKPRAEFLQDPANLALPLGKPLRELLEGYRAVLFDYNFLRYIANTAYVAVTTMVLTLVLSVLGAYAVARLDFPGRRLMERAVLLTYMFPAIVLAIPLYAIFTLLGLRDTLSGLVIVYLAQTLPVALYMLRSYFETVPASLEEAGLIDGCSRFEVIWRITLPLSLPALASVGLYVFMIAWNEFLFAFMFLDTPEIFTLSRGMVALNSQEVPYQYLMAGAVIVTVPVMLLFFWFERYLVGGLTAGGVKG